MAGEGDTDTWAARRERALDRVHARLAAGAARRGARRAVQGAAHDTGSAPGFVTPPEPRSIGSPARGRQLSAGSFLFAGQLVEAPDTPIWDLDMPTPSFERALHGCLWLDDLAAQGDIRARARAQDWVWGWIDRFGAGQGPGWTPALTGRRLTRWIHHGVFLLAGRGPAEGAQFFAALAAQTTYLSRRWRGARSGLPKFEALTGLLFAGLALRGQDRHAGPALRALIQQCDAQIDAQGALPSRNPEELLEVFTLLTWVGQALATAGQPMPEPLREASARIAPTLRALRHADGGLARFHGGGRGAEGRLDHALASSGVRAGPRNAADAREPAALTMGYARLSAGRCSLLIDAAPPPQGEASRTGHASTLAFEMTSGRRPLIVNCGSGASFGETWRRAGRATPSHSTLGIDGVSSSRFAGVQGRNAGSGDGAAQLDSPAELLAETPRDVRVQASATGTGRSLLIGHDGWVATHGLTHMRKLVLGHDGRELSGEDTLGAMTELHRRRFERVVAEQNLRGIAFSIRFHLHPDVEANVDDDPDLNGGHGVTLSLRSGEVWRFRHDGTGVLSVAPSVYLEPGRLKPRATRQLVLSARVLDYACQIGWTLGKAQDTPQGIRDLARGDDDDLAYD
ncbi:MAG: heparinase II/III family protein [Celeribacter sp.]|jgi:uncharacterized heparinase superfamily protein